MTRSLRASAAPVPAARPAVVGETVVRRPDPEAWSLALGIAGGDVRRCQPLPDGGVLVHNRAVGGR